MQLQCNGLSTHYEQTGQGKDILMLHGWGASGQSFDCLVGRLSTAYRVTTLDFPGFGQSELPPEPWDVEAYARFTLSFMQAVGLSDPILIGHSFGGRVILKLCGTGRVSPEKIVLLDAAGIRHKRSFAARCKVACFKTAKWALTRRPWQKACQPTLERVRRYFGSADYNSAPPVLRQTLVRVVNEDLRDCLPHIAAPTLLVYGERDTATPVSDAKLMQKMLPDGGLCVIPEAGHWAFAERPAHVLSILDSFLEIH